jgi:signal transduction histidine kinase
MCYHLGMIEKPPAAAIEQHLEPGFLQVFRLYAWIRLLALAMIPLVWLRVQQGTEGLGPGPGFLRPEIDPNANINFSLAFAALNGVALLAYLYWPWLQQRLGRYYASFGILLAIAGLLIEQQILSANLIYWQVSAFAYFLLILVAWQFDFLRAVLFSITIAAFEILLLQISSPPTVVIQSIEITGRLIIFGVIMRSIAFMGLGYVITRLAQAQRQQRQALAEANQKLVSHAAALEQLTLTRERVRLSRELHDTLAHTLSAQAVQIDAIMAAWEPLPDKAHAMLERMLVTTRSGLDETRRALTALRATPLEDIGLALALRALAEDFAARYALELALEVPENLDDLPPEVEQCFYRVAQESLENIARHAQAGWVALHASQRNGPLEMRISDDGLGFDPDEATKDRQLGIKGMYERAELIGGALNIESQPGHGTIVSLRWEAKP